MNARSALTALLTLTLPDPQAELAELDAKENAAASLEKAAAEKAAKAQAQAQAAAQKAAAAAKEAKSKKAKQQDDGVGLGDVLGLLFGTSVVAGGIALLLASDGPKREDE